MQLLLFDKDYLEQLEQCSESFRQHLNSCHPKELYAKTPILDLIEGRELPPNGVLPNQRIYLFMDDERNVIGFAVIYFGHPNQDYCYIGTFSINQEYKGKGLGKIAFDLLLHKIYEEKNCKIRLGVDHCNLEAFGFWFSRGFTKLTKVSSKREPPVLELEYVG